MSKKFVIIEESSDYILARGITDNFHEAVGKAVCILTDNEEEWIGNGYAVIESDDFFRLECDNGFGWRRVYLHSEPVIRVTESIYVLTVDE